jgi:hypothetical protein
MSSNDHDAHGVDANTIPAANSGNAAAGPSFGGIPLHADQLEALMKTLAKTAATESDPIAFARSIAALLGRK